MKQRFDSQLMQSAVRECRDQSTRLTWTVVVVQVAAFAFLILSPPKWAVAADDIRPASLAKAPSFFLEHSSDIDIFVQVLFPLDLYFPHPIAAGIRLGVFNPSFRKLCGVPTNTLLPTERETLLKLPASSDLATDFSAHNPLQP